MEEKPEEKPKIIKLMSHPTFKERWALANLIPGHPLKGPTKEEMFYLRQSVKRLQEDTPPEPSKSQRKKRLRVVKNQEAKKQEKEEQ